MHSMHDKLVESMDRIVEDKQLYQSIHVGRPLRFDTYPATDEPYEAFDLIRHANGHNLPVGRIPPPPPEGTG